MPTPKNNIAVVWDFDHTLSPIDSTTKTIEILQEGKPGEEFWEYIKSLTGNSSPNWEHILASHAPAWMYSLSRLAFEKKVPLNTEFFFEFVVRHINLYPNVFKCLSKIKDLENTERFRAANLEIHHFIVSAGLKDLIDLVFPKNLITYTFGCRYVVIANKDQPEIPESIPVFCMDESMKTRSLFEISKGSFIDETKSVNTRVESSDLWAPFPNIIYIGDGPTDVPALSLTRYNGGMGIVVFDPDKNPTEVEKKLKKMRLDKRADLITRADFSLSGELFEFIQARCIQICQRYETSRSVA